MLRVLSLMFLMMVSYGAVIANEESSEEKTVVKVEDMLYLGPVSWKGMKDWGSVKPAALLQKSMLTRLSERLPKAGESHSFFGQSYQWNKGKAFGSDKDSFFLVSLNAEADAYSKGSLIVEGATSATLFVDGVEASGAEQRFELSLDTGSHQFLLWLRGEGDEVSLSWESESPLSFHTRPERRISNQWVIDAPNVSGTVVSPDGERILVDVSTYSKEQKRWVNVVHELDKAGKPVRLWDNGGYDFKFSPDGKWLAYRKGNNLVMTSAGKEVVLLKNWEHVAEYQWSKTSDSLFFSNQIPAEKRTEALKRYQALEDRWSNWRDLNHLYQVDLDGNIRQLTEKESRYFLFDNKGQKLLYGNSIVDYKTLPFSTTALHEYDLKSGAEQELGNYPSVGGALYAPKGIYLLATASIGDGSSLDKGKINDYDTQLFLLKNGKAKSLSRKLDPSIDSMYALNNGDLLLRVTEGQGNEFYHFEHKSKKTNRLETSSRVMYSVSVSKDSIVFTGEASQQPSRVYQSKLKEWSPELVFGPADEHFAQITFGKMERWTYKSQGDELEGFYFLPPNFDPSKKYPMITYYYGGTVPVTETFGGRYPKNVWAARGYVVLIVQPSGAIGYGQEFSSRHVNAWGKRTADDIITGVKTFVKEHSFVDEKRIGCMGASYGGFMTMYLVTQTDLFSAAISHAGISNLSGYWGQGWWGFAYSGAASKGSYPWNNKDLYVEQSPLYHADKVNTPLLLVTGDADTNVPPGQSHDMYTALKILGREVELVTFNNEDHWILDYERRMDWWHTLLGWFDKHLKGEDAAWQALYPDK